MALLIKNVKILGGSEKFSEVRDVFINDDKITAVGNFSDKTADEIISGNGAYLSPGFIDVNTDSDHYLTVLDHPGQDDFLRQGVTTIIGGMCGSSLAPLIYGDLESVQKWGDTNKFNIGWHTVKEFLDVLDKRPLGVNFATLIGHSTIRRAIVGDELRGLSKNELGVFGEILKRALREGGFGLSAGLGYVHGQAAKYSEIKFLAEVVKKFNGVYAAHLKNADISETIKLAEETGVKILISHFMPFSGTGMAYEKALDLMEKLPEDLSFDFDVYPYDASLLPLYVFLPEWAKNGGKDKMLANLKDDWLRAKIEKDLPGVKPADFFVARASGNDFLVGRSLADLEKLFGAANEREALIKLMLTTELKCLALYKNINKNLIARALKHPRSLIASNSASFPENWRERILKPERAVSTFTKFIELAVSQSLMPLEQAVEKLTKHPAKKFDLKERGVVKEGNFADLTMFSVNKEPSGKGVGVEIKLTVVNGKIAFRDGNPSGILGGKIFRHKKA